MGRLGLTSLLGVSLLCGVARCEVGCCACREAISDTAAHCLQRCGFAIVADAYASSDLAEIGDAFRAWHAADDDVVRYKERAARSTLRKYLSKEQIQQVAPGLRGKREEIVVPDTLPFNSALFNPLVVGAVGGYMRAVAGKGAAPSLEYMTFIHSMRGSDSQHFHQDSSFVDGVKVQVPLVDVELEMGPVEIRSVRADGEIRRVGDIRGDNEVSSQSSDTCSQFNATTRRGAAILYLHTAYHRGTANAHATRDRTVLDFSYLLPAHAERNAYLRGFSLHARQTQQSHNRRFAILCAEAGVACSMHDVVGGDDDDAEDEGNLLFRAMQSATRMAVVAGLLLTLLSLDRRTVHIAYTLVEKEPMLLLPLIVLIGALIIAFYLSLLPDERSYVGYHTDDNREPEGVWQSLLAMLAPGFARPVRV